MKGIIDIMMMVATSNPNEWTKLVDLSRPSWGGDAPETLQNFATKHG